jgi:hypothetical protein
MTWIECYQVFDAKDNVPCSTTFIDGGLCDVCYGDEN